MAGQIELDPTELKAAAERSKSIADAIGTARTALLQTLTANGSPWGSDSFGGKFAKGDQGYVAARDSLLAGMANLAGTFEQIYQGQVDAANSFAETETVRTKQLAAVA
ncbi:uncharacterized protein YukE [Nocardia sp. GAS34]|uniref:hypothetical protein n=1 Tax=unclassified Nocardia TaxID=2637762 RepID=UPI003D246049